MGEDQRPLSWWQTVPGILTAVAALITAITGLLLALHQVGLIGAWKSAQKGSTTSNTSDAEPAGPFDAQLLELIEQARSDFMSKGKLKSDAGGTQYFETHLKLGECLQPEIVYEVGSISYRCTLLPAIFRTSREARDALALRAQDVAPHVPSSWKKRFTPTDGTVFIANNASESLEIRIYVVRHDKGNYSGSFLLNKLIKR
jgi:hypothetical protein